MKLEAVEKDDLQLSVKPLKDEKGMDMSGLEQLQEEAEGLSKFPAWVIIVVSMLSTSTLIFITMFVIFLLIKLRKLPKLANFSNDIMLESPRNSTQNSAFIDPSFSSVSHSTMNPVTETVVETTLANCSLNDPQNSVTRDLCLSSASQMNVTPKNEIEGVVEKKTCKLVHGIL